ncbi:MAG: DUF58 domain-containing protein [Pseudomonadota bacterium]
MSQSAVLREASESLAAPLPPLLADAEHLASTVLLGSHGRRRAGMGDEFWQYRPATASDSARRIDWRRSARSDDAHFVRETEWQAAQSVQLWVDNAQSMTFSSKQDIPSKLDRARTLALAIAVLLIRAGERVGLSGRVLPPRAGRLQLMRLADLFTATSDDADYGEPEARGMLPQSRALFISDFFGDTGPVEVALTKAADRGVKGVLLQTLDPQEESFPFDGRTRFLSMGGSVEFETLKASNLRDAYLERLAERKDWLERITRVTGWRYTVHHTDTPPLPALLWLYGALERVR